MSLYTKTALKKIKKDELVQMFLDLQAQKVDNMMDEVVEKCCNNAIEEVVEGLKAENEKFKNTIVSLKSSVDDLREARDMRDHQIEKLKEGKLSKFQCDKCKGHHTGCANPTCDSCVKEIEEENEKLKEEIKHITNELEWAQINQK